MAVKAYTEPGDAVLLQQPVYYPFSEVIVDNKRRAVSNTLYRGSDNRYHMDFEDFEQKIIQEKVKLFFLCNPHNPVGRVWTREELDAAGISQLGILGLTACEAAYSKGEEWYQARYAAGIM